jgi:hypothetical protein
VADYAAVGSEDFGESLNGHGETGNGPDADVEHFQFPNHRKERVSIIRRCCAWNQEICKL